VSTTADTWTVRSADGTEIAIHELGGSGPTVVVVHATGFCAEMYRPLANELSEHYRLVALDVRGHGDSALPASGSFAWKHMAEDLTALVDALGEGPFLAFGHSMGGATILLAERMRPGTFRRAFVFEPIVFPANTPRLESNFMAETARARRATFASAGEVHARYASRPPFNVLRADALLAYVRHGFVEAADGSVTLKCAPGSEAATFEGHDALRSDELGPIVMPVMVAMGEDTPDSNPARFAPQVAEGLPNGHLLRLDHVGHFGPFQDPVTVARHVRHWFEAHPQ
jgi:pimeloyl-ACP methyl ester carboxylesterase